MLFLFFFNDTATTEIYTLSLHDALPISIGARQGQLVEEARGPAIEGAVALAAGLVREGTGQEALPRPGHRSEEHTSELQSRSDLVCRLLLEKKKSNQKLRHSASEHIFSS